MKFNLKTFKIDPKEQWRHTSPWGGGHTVETDPTRRGWCMKLTGSCLVIGRRGRMGCISVQSLSNNQLHVTVYEDESPSQVDAWLKIPPDLRNEQGPWLDPMYKQVQATPGWALPFIHFLEALELAVGEVNKSAVSGKFHYLLA